jgi:hypothetical protein
MLGFIELKMGLGKNTRKETLFGAGISEQAGTRYANL